MFSSSPPNRLPAAPLLALALAASGCGPDDPGAGPVEIPDSRVATRVYANVELDATSYDRFGNPFESAAAGDRAGAAEGAPAESGGRPPVPFVWEVPASWREVEPRSTFRFADFEVAGDARAECYATILDGAAGGVVSNINRWAENQLGLEPLTAEEIAALPRFPVLGAAAFLYEAEGTFSGMSGPPLEDARLMGLVVEDPQFTLFVKLTGPREIVLSQREAFFDFAASIQPRGRVEAVDDGNLADEPTPTAGESAGAGAEPAGDSYTFDLPAGWSREAPRQFLLMSFAAGAAGSVTLSHVGGTLEENLERWYRQMGQTAPDGLGLLGMERTMVLGLSSLVVDLSGDFTGMSGGTRSDQRMLGVICPRHGDALYIKLVGPADAVAAERERFLAFAQSLKAVDGR